MSNVVRGEVSGKNPYWISKNRHYELKYFCLQYPEWKKAYEQIVSVSSVSLVDYTSKKWYNDLTGTRAVQKAYYSDKIRLVEQIALATNSELHNYILRGVTEGLSYTYLRTVLDMPCGKDLYYTCYRRFFWLLDQSR